MSPMNIRRSYMYASPCSILRTTMKFLRTRTLPALTASSERQTSRTSRWSRVNRMYSSMIPIPTNHALVLMRRSSSSTKRAGRASLTLSATSRRRRGTTTNFRRYIPRTRCLIGGPAFVRPSPCILRRRAAGGQGDRPRRHGVIHNPFL